MTKIAQTGYSIQEALSELIDNSIDARFPNKKIKIEGNNPLFLNDPDKISWTYSHILPNFLNIAVEHSLTVPV